MFESYCREHLLDERAVMEASLLRFLEGSEQERRAIAGRYMQWQTEQEESQGRGPKRK